MLVPASCAVSCASLLHAIGFIASQAHVAARSALTAGHLRKALSVLKFSLPEWLLNLTHYVQATPWGEPHGIETPKSVLPLNAGNRKAWIAVGLRRKPTCATFRFFMNIIS